MADLFFLLGKNFNSIKSIFASKIKSSGLNFNEDVFMDTILKCDKKLKDSTLDNDQMIRYLWVAFKNNTLRELNYFRNKSTDIFPENLLEEPEDKSLFYEVSDIIIKEFGEPLYHLFVLHANGATYNDLDKISDVPDLKYQFRKIREFVRERLSGELLN